MAWRDEDRWQSLRDPAGCPICVAGRPDDLLVELPASWVTAGREAPLAGYACVISKVHAVEPFELFDRGLAFWGDAVRVAEALNAELRPVKMNYEIHGNTIPHLHMHLYPRTADDPFVGRPIDASAASAIRSTAELDAMRAAVEGAGQPTPPLPAVGVVVRREDEVLLATHSYHADKRFVLIAGYVEPGESVEEAAVREVAEETGLEVVVDRLLGSYSWHPGGLPVLFIACEARVVGGTLRLSDELEDVRWFRLASLPTWPAGFPVADIMARLLQET